ncbi:TPA: hypothetical protein L6A27_08690 [Pseudomonas aeruginosa]|nr:hypothetical protein B7D75_00285 [Pseudomonas paraeruginosa]OPD73137.1 hypothetical protein AO903_32555 [Pseudomonas aeruginosa]RQB80290.1 hypothetical protein IPC434_29070 [Pseudomonas aeruginosa]HBP6037592.1 hypothetical protein [Pseudomonas aeruginosa]
MHEPYAPSIGHLGGRQSYHSCPGRFVMQETYSGNSDCISFAYTKEAGPPGERYTFDRMPQVGKHRGVVCCYGAHRHLAIFSSGEWNRA